MRRSTVWQPVPFHIPRDPLSRLETASDSYVGFLVACSSYDEGRRWLRQGFESACDG